MSGEQVFVVQLGVLMVQEMVQMVAQARGSTVHYLMHSPARGHP
jgi:hypothetical protein